MRPDPATSYMQRPDPGPRPSGLEWRHLWRTRDKTCEADAAAFWRREGLLADDERIDERQGQLNICVYSEGSLVGVSTARLRDTPFLRTRLAMHRVAVAADRPRTNLSLWITIESISALEAWSLAHPEEGVTGVGAVIQAKLDARADPIWRTGLNLVGYTQQHAQFRVAWFPHAKLQVPGR